MMILIFNEHPIIQERFSKYINDSQLHSCRRPASRQVLYRDNSQHRSCTSTKLISMFPCIRRIVIVLRAYRSMIFMNTSQNLNWKCHSPDNALQLATVDLQQKCALWNLKVVKHFYRLFRVRVCQVPLDRGRTSQEWGHGQQDHICPRDSLPPRRHA